MKQNNLDVLEFCNHCAISIKEFYNIMKSNPDINPVILAKICEQYNWKLLDILE